MSRDYNDDSLKLFYNFLLKISSGDLTCRMHSLGKDDPLEYLAFSLNMAIEELATEMHQVNPAKSYLHSMILTFTINSSAVITDVGAIAAQKLSYHHQELINRPITAILNRNCWKIFEKQFEEFKASEITTSRPFSLDFETAEGFIMSMECQFDVFLKDGEYQQFVVMGTKILPRNEAQERRLHKKAIRNFQKRKYPTNSRKLLMRDHHELAIKIQQFIKKRLDTQLPHLEEIASEMGASKSKVKAAFKRRFEMGIFAYHREQRLEKALVLLKTTEKNVGTIGKECGYNNPDHFATAFKKRFGYRPSDLRQKKN